MLNQRLLRRAVAVATVALAAVTLPACGGSSAPAASPTVRVVATNFAMAALVRGVGGSRVRVTNLSAGAPDDRTLVPSSQATAAMAAAQLIVEVGGGWQPQVETAVGTGPRVLAVGRQGSATGSQVWLDPVSMEGAARILESRLVTIDPAGAAEYRNGVRDFNDNLASTSADYQSSLADCQYPTMFTPDGAFASVASRYGLELHPVASASSVEDAATAAQTQSFHAVFSEPPLTSPQITALAARGKAKVGELDTMDGPPIRDEPATSTYVDRLEANLKYLTGGLYCQDNGLS